MGLNQGKGQGTVESAEGRCLDVPHSATNVIDHLLRHAVGISKRQQGHDVVLNSASLGRANGGTLEITQVGSILSSLLELLTASRTLRTRNRLMCSGTVGG